MDLKISKMLLEKKYKMKTLKGIKEIIDKYEVFILVQFDLSAELSFI